PNPSDFSLTIHGEVERPLTLDFAGLLRSDNVELTVDVHCVTGWSVLGARFKGVRVRDLAERVGVKSTARHVIFEGAHGYTANVRLDEALAPDVLVAHRLDGRALARPHGAPVRAVVPSLYFWKSPKWLTGIRFVRRDEPGYWETRGYNNHADPWLEERYA
ncbi:MAG: molybdopterin-dependent oxidoreductase, partial [Myxococcales bacterium]|nr:molybdopterin-dependent oxidoreductase [Myxococcales bacterium]